MTRLENENPMTLPDIPEGYRLVTVGHVFKGTSEWSCAIEKIGAHPTKKCIYHTGKTPREAVLNAIGKIK